MPLMTVIRDDILRIILQITDYLKNVRIIIDKLSNILCLKVFEVFVTIN